MLKPFQIILTKPSHYNKSEVVTLSYSQFYRHGRVSTHYILRENSQLNIHVLIFKYNNHERLFSKSYTETDYYNIVRDINGQPIGISYIDNSHVPLRHLLNATYLLEKGLKKEQVLPLLKTSITQYKEKNLPKNCKYLNIDLRNHTIYFDLFYFIEVYNSLDFSKSRLNNLDAVYEQFRKSKIHVLKNLIVGKYYYKDQSIDADTFISDSDNYTNIYKIVNIPSKTRKYSVEYPINNNIIDYRASAYTNFINSRGISKSTNTQGFPIRFGYYSYTENIFLSGYKEPFNTYYDIHTDGNLNYSLYNYNLVTEYKKHIITYYALISPIHNKYTNDYNVSEQVPPNVIVGGTSYIYNNSENLVITHTEYKVKCIIPNSKYLIPVSVISTNIDPEGNILFSYVVYDKQFNYYNYVLCFNKGIQTIYLVDFVINPSFISLVYELNLSTSLIYLETYTDKEHVVKFLSLRGGLYSSSLGFTVRMQDRKHLFIGGKLYYYMYKKIFFMSTLDNMYNIHSYKFY